MFVLVHSPVDTHHTFCPETQAELWTVFIEVPTVLRRKPPGGQLVGEPEAEGGLGAMAMETDGSFILAGKVPRRAYANTFLLKTRGFRNLTVYHKGTRAEL